MAAQRIDGAAIIDDLYAGTMDYARWEKAILRLAELIGSACAGLFSMDLKTGRILRDEGYRVPRDGIERYREWVVHDPRRELMNPQPVLVPLGEAQLMPLRQWHGTEIFNEFLKPFDCAYFLCTLLHKSAVRMVALSFQATVDHGPFTDDERQRLEPYLGHVARALEIRDRFDEHAIRADTLTSGLGRATFGLMVLDERGRILEANANAEHLLRSDSGVTRDRDGALRLTGRADLELCHWLQHGRSTSGRPEATIPVVRPMLPTLSVMMTAVPHVAPLWIGSNPRWIAFLFDPSMDALPSAHLLSHVLAISDREAEVAALLAQGLELREIAARLRISVHTARGHLKSVFSKTGTRSQADLVRRIVRVPTEGGGKK